MDQEVHAFIKCWRIYQRSLAGFVQKKVLLRF